jgi:Tfp pilus assembly protein PilF
MARGLQDIADALRRGQQYGRGCTLLIGAGCSKTAKIPLAGEIVDHIRNSGLYDRVYQLALQRAKSLRPDAVVPTYGQCMEEMDRGDQRDLLRGYIKNARLNWAHAGIASLVKHGYVDRILTTNFDPLIARACAVFNEIPAVYDLTMSVMRRFDDLPDKAIFHLHGQQNGFSLLNSPSELADHKKNIKPLIERVRETRTWIVCGYSGLNDPLFELIEDCGRYEHGLYWIGREPTPAAHLNGLVGPDAGKGGHYVPFDGADEFFIRLCGSLGIVDFQFMHRPLDHIEELLDQFVDFPKGATDEGIDLLHKAKVSIGRYKARINEASAQESADQKVAEMIAIQGLTSALATVSEDRTLAAEVSPDMRAMLMFLEGLDLHKKADESQEPAQAIAIYQKASDKYAAALAIKPDNHKALSNWGLVLDDQARRSPDDEAHKLWAEAGDKYAAALAIKPDTHEVLYNWGVALDARAQRSPDDLARRLWAEAGEKYAAALAIKPDTHEALNNWGSALDDQAQRSPDDEARKLWAEAGVKYAAALAIKPDKHETLNNWGLALAAQARRSIDDEARSLWAEAGVKYAAALAIKPGMHEALSNWGNALVAHAQRSPDNEARNLWAMAYEKYTAALAIKPDNHGALNNWGSALDDQAQRSPDDEARKLWAEAGDKYAAALAIKPDMYEALNNWSSALISSAHRSSGAERQELLAEAHDRAYSAEALVPGICTYNLACIQAMRGELTDMTQWLDRSYAAGTLPTREHIAADKDFDSVRETPEFKAWLSKMGWLH